MAAAGLACLEAGYEADEWGLEKVEQFKKIMRFLSKESKESLIEIIGNLMAIDQELLDNLTPD